jgi:hypothetical protein
MQMPVRLSNLHGISKDARRSDPYVARMLAARGIAALVALASLPPAGAAMLWAMLVFLIAGHGPDPAAPAGSPCCKYADTWGEVAGGVAWGLALAVVSVALLYAGITLAQFALKGRRPKLLRLRRLIVSASTTVVLSAAFLLAPV